MSRESGPGVVDAPRDSPASNPSGTVTLPDPTAAHLSRIDDAVAARTRKLYESIDREILGSLRTAFADAAHAHREALERCALDRAGSDSEDGGPAGLARHLEGYRSDVRTRVLEPLAASMAQLDPGDAIPSRLETLRGDLRALAGGVPDEVGRPEPRALYDPTPRDGRWTRMRKATVRFRRGVRRFTWVLARTPRRLIGQTIPPPPARIQHVPLAQLVEYHVGVRVPVALNPFHDRTLLHLGRVVAGVERAAARWTRTLLDVESRVDRASFHRPESLLAIFQPESVPKPETLGSSAAQEASESEDDDDPRAALDRAVEGLSSALEVGSRLAIEAGFLTEVEDQLSLAATTLARDVEAAGSFMLRMSNRVPTLEQHRTPFQIRCERWRAWHRQATARVQLIERITWLRGELVCLEAALGESVGDVVSRVLEEFQSAAGLLRQLGAEADRMFADATGSGDSSVASAFVAEITGRATRGLAERLLDPLRERSPARATVAEGVDAVDRLVDLVARAPETLTIHVIPERADAEPDVRAPERDVRLREICRSSIDALLVEDLRHSVDPVAAFLEGAEAAANEIPTIIHYNLDAALEELGTAETSDGSDFLDHPRELTVTGLTRAADQLDAAVRGAPAAVDQFVGAAFETYRRGWSRVRDRALVEARVQEELMDLRTRVVGSLRALADTLESRYRLASRALRRLVRRGGRRARKLLELGQTAVGASQVSDREAEKTLEELAGLERLIDSLPLVYRRLFSFQPVSDRALLEGRDSDLTWIRQRYERWQPSVGSPLIITGAAGSGMTSFLKVIPEVLEDSSAAYVEIGERIRDESVAARVIGEALGFASSSTTLAALAERILREPTPERPRVVTVDRLEHTFLRAPGASALIGRLLAFMSRTAPRVLWIGAMVDQAWQIVEKTEGRASGLPQRHQLDPIDRTELQSLILGRHRRSGLPLVFEDPAENPLLRRRLRRALDEEERQSVLKEHFFDRLHRLSNQNIRLALYYWLRSTVFHADRGIVRIQPLQPLSFGFLEQLEMPETFTLKALLQHATLTLDEHDQVFRVSREESFEVFSTLHKSLLIETEGAVGSGNDGEPAIDEHRRYRIRPLLTGPVEQFLRDKNIVH